MLQCEFPTPNYLIISILLAVFVFAITFFFISRYIDNKQEDNSYLKLYGISLSILSLSIISLIIYGSVILNNIVTYYQWSTREIVNIVTVDDVSHSSSYRIDYKDKSSGIIKSIYYDYPDAKLNDTISEPIYNPIKACLYVPAMKSPLCQIRSLDESLMVKLYSFEVTINGDVISNKKFKTILSYSDKIGLIHENVEFQVNYTENPSEQWIDLKSKKAVLLYSLLSN